MQSPSRQSRTALTSVLVIDDEPLSQRVVEKVLQQGGYRVVLAGTAEQALLLALKEPPALILIDYMLPDLDGSSLARLFRAQPSISDTPLIFLTASKEETSIAAAFAAGADDYIHKPVDPRILLARVNSILQARRDREHSRQAEAAAEERDLLKKDLHQARAVQQALLPAFPARFGGWVVSGAVVSCQEVGGDVLQLIPTQQGRWVAYMVDVAGHGIAAALWASSVSSDFQLLLRTHRVASAMAALSTRLAEGSIRRYVCVAAVELSDGQATVVNAGLPPVCVVRGGEVVASFQGNGPPPGLLSEASYRAARLDLELGDRIVVMSDGLTEPFGPVEAVVPVVNRLGLVSQDASVNSLPPPKIESLIRNLFASAPQTDDASLMLLERSSA